MFIVKIRLKFGEEEYIDGYTHYADDGNSVMLRVMEYVLMTYNVENCDLCEIELTKERQ